MARDAPAATAHGVEMEQEAWADRTDAADAPEDEVPDELVLFAQRARELGGAQVGIAVRARPRTGDTAVSMAIVTPTGERRVRRIVFLTGPMGRSRAALAAAAFLLETLRQGGTAQ
jgi:ABC-type amino acid transport substrate-binding protein